MPLKRQITQSMEDLKKPEKKNNSGKNAALPVNSQHSRDFECLLTKDENLPASCMLTINSQMTLY